MLDDIVEVVAEFVLEWIFGETIEKKWAEWKERRRRKRREKENSEKGSE